jgi:hypothetical protein
LRFGLLVPGARQRWTVLYDLALMRIKMITFRVDEKIPEQEMK